MLNKLHTIPDRNSFANNTASESGSVFERDDRQLIRRVFYMRLGRSPNYGFRVNDAGSGIGAFAHSSRSQDANHAGCARAAEILCQPDAVARYLTFAGISAQLHDYIAYLANSGCPHRMTFRFQTAACIDGHRSANRRAARRGKRATFAFSYEAEVFGGHNFSDGEAVVNFSELYLAGVK